MEHCALFPPHPTSLVAVRRFVAQTAESWGLEAFPIVLLSDELATNALDHAHTDFEVRMAIDDGGVLVEVSDDSAAMPALRALDTVDERGRGLRLVNELAARWGAERRGRGKAVWFVLEAERADVRVVPTIWSWRARGRARRGQDGRKPRRSDTGRRA